MPACLPTCPAAAPGGRLWRAAPAALRQRQPPGRALRPAHGCVPPPARCLALRAGRRAAAAAVAILLLVPALHHPFVRRLQADSCRRRRSHLNAAFSPLLPAVGVAKHLLRVEGLLPERAVRAAVAASGAAGEPGAAAAGAAYDACEPDAAAGEPQQLAGDSDSRGSRASSWLPLAGAGGEVLGAAVCAAGGSSRPIYVSVGHRISLPTAVEVVRRCCRHRWVLPTAGKGIGACLLLPCPALSLPGPALRLCTAVSGQRPSTSLRPTPSLAVPRCTA